MVRKLDIRRGKETDYRNRGEGYTSIDALNQPCRCSVGQYSMLEFAANGSTVEVEPRDLSEQEWRAIHPFLELPRSPGTAGVFSEEPGVGRPGHRHHMVQDQAQENQANYRYDIK